MAASCVVGILAADFDATTISESKNTPAPTGSPPRCYTPADKPNSLAKLCNLLEGLFPEAEFADADHEWGSQSLASVDVSGVDNG